MSTSRRIRKDTDPLRVKLITINDSLSHLLKRINPECGGNRSRKRMEAPQTIQLTKVELTDFYKKKKEEREEEEKLKKQ